MPSKPFATCDCETDPFLKDRIPRPFIWGFYDGKDFTTFRDTARFVDFIKNKRIIVYAHNGGKFDFMFMLKFIVQTRAQIINGRIVSMSLGECELRDSYAAIPEALEKFGGKGKIDYAKMEGEVREENMPEIIEYLFGDCKSLYDTMAVYRNVAGKQKTIASNALAFAKKIGIDPGRTNYRFDEKYRRFYFGGRTECFQPGTHHNIRILDINSAYPFAMTHDHATGDAFMRRGNLDGMSTEEIQRSFIILECDSAGAFPTRTIGPNGGLSFPHERREYYVTGWEYIVACEFGLIRDVVIKSVRVTGATINFKDYVAHWFEYKKKHSAKDEHDKRLHPIEYTVGKTMMNSLYGKLSQNPARYFDYKYCPAGTPICLMMLPDGNPAIDPNTDICSLCNEKGKNHGWKLHAEFDEHEIHRREALWRYRYEFGSQWQARSLFNNVASGASITGFTRAHLLRAMHTVGCDAVIYCDTDSMFVRHDADISGLSQSEKLGDWKLEGTATIGHFAGKKIYGVDLGAHLDKDERFKIASKGSKLSYDNIMDIVAGKTVKWENQAPTFHIDGSADFVVRNIRATGVLPETKPALK